MNKSSKPSKAAYNDLKSMGKGALTRGTKAIDAALATLVAQKVQRTEANAASAGLSAAKRKKVEEAAKAASESFFALRHTLALEIDCSSLGQDMKMTEEASKTANWAVPHIIRVPPIFLENALLKAEIDQCKTAFNDSVAKATAGKAIRSVSPDRRTWETNVHRGPLLSSSARCAGCIQTKLKVSGRVKRRAGLRLRP